MCVFANVADSEKYALCTMYLYTSTSSVNVYVLQNVCKYIDKCIGGIKYAYLYNVLFIQFGQSGNLQIFARVSRDSRAIKCRQLSVHLAKINRFILFYFLPKKKTESLGKYAAQVINFKRKKFLKINASFATKCHEGKTRVIFQNTAVITRE